MKLTTTNTPDFITHTLEISAEELVAADFDEPDTALIRECQASPRISDKLLALETVARRIEEVHERKKHANAQRSTTGAHTPDGEPVSPG